MPVTLYVCLCVYACVYMCVRVRVCVEVLHAQLCFSLAQRYGAAACAPGIYVSISVCM